MPHRTVSIIFQALLMIAALNRAIFMIWITRQGVRVIINVRLILRLRRHVSEVAWNGLRGCMVLWRRRVSAVDIRRAKLLNAQAELFAERIMLIRVGRR